MSGSAILISPPFVGNFVGNFVDLLVSAWDSDKVCDEVSDKVWEDGVINFNQDLTGMAGSSLVSVPTPRPRRGTSLSLLCFAGVGSQTSSQTLSQTPL